MAKKFVYSTYKNTFDDIPAVVDHMTELQNELRRTDLSNLQFFNSTYLIITKNVYNKIGTDYFSHENEMKKLDINFAKYYFDALKNYIGGKPTTPSWKTVFDCYKQDASIPLIYLALGVNAHVNNDLGLSLFDVIKIDDFKKDFTKVNPVIFKSVDEILTHVGLHKFYKPFMQLLIFHWRKKAWRNFTDLQNQVKTKSEIETNALGIAESLAQIHSVKDFYHLYKII